MKYAFNSCTYTSIGGWIPAYPIKEVMERLARIGYDGIEIPCSAPDTWPYYLNEDKIKQIDIWQKNANIQIASLMPCPGGATGGNLASMYDAEREWSVQYAKDVIDLAVAWGAKIIAYVPGWAIFGTRYKDARAKCADSLKRVAAHAHSKDEEIIICIENTAADSNLIDTIDDSLDLIDEVGMPNVGIMFDTAHTLFRQEDASDWAYTAGKHLKHIHMSDSDRLPPGCGTMDFFPVMRALKDMNFSGYVTMEVGFGRNVSPDSYARLSLEHLKEIEAKV